MQNLSVETFKEEHLSDILKLERELFEEPYSEETLRRELELPFSLGLVAKLNGETAGYCLAWLIGETCELHRIGVKGELQGRGIGRALLKTLLKEAAGKGAREVILEVNEKNRKAISLYRALVSERKNYYGNDGALIMKLNLQEEKMLRDENLKALAREKFHHFKTLEKKHQELDDIIDKMEKKAVLTPKEEQELERMKKERLRLRDEMMLLMKKAKEEAENEK